MAKITNNHSFQYHKFHFRKDQSANTSIQNSETVHTKIILCLYEIKFMSLCNFEDDMRM